MSRTTIDVRKGTATVAVILAVLVAGVAVGVSAAAAADEPNEPPAAYYGDITIDGESAPEGTTIQARIDGEVRGEITTEQTGGYGGPNATDGKLTVNGTESDEGSTVEFFVVQDDGSTVQADQTVTWSSGDQQRVDLTVQTPDESTPTPTPSSTPTPTEAPDGGSGGGGDSGGSGGGGDSGGSSGGGGGGGGGAAPPQPAPAFQVTSTTINETMIDVNGTVAVNVTVENTGDADGEYTARLTSGGFTLANGSVTVPAGESREVTLVDTFGRQGSYRLMVNDEITVGTLYVGVEPAEVIAAETVPLDDGTLDDGLRIEFGNVPVRSITFSNESATGNATVEELSRVPLDASQPEGTVFEVVSIDVPATEADSPATLEMIVTASDLEETDASADDLTIVRYDESEEVWSELETDVVESDGDVVVVAAETPGFSLFAVTAQEQEEPTPTPTETPSQSSPTPTDVPTATETTTDEPPEDQSGFVNPFVLGGIVFLAMLGAVLAVAGKRLYENGGL